jgi:tRNA pseudouridine38-40 synthase
MRNLLFTISFCGTAYHGWQVQNNAVTVQQTVQDAIEKIIQKRENIVGCSRTDAGVHANMYCFNMKTESVIPCEKLVSGINAMLPDDISVIDCSEVNESFHARYDCKRKEYKYLILNSKISNPFLVNRAFLYPYKIDVAFLNEQAKQFIGRFDYSAFCNAGSSVEDTVRSVDFASVTRDVDLVEFTVSADGFLYNMVRIMVGTLLDISSGKIPENSIKDIILSKNRDSAGFTAPGCGLYLNKVEY